METVAPAKVMFWRHFSWCRFLLTQVLAVQSPAFGAAPAIPKAELSWRHGSVPHIIPFCSSDRSRVCWFGHACCVEMWAEHSFVLGKVSKGQLAVLDTVVGCEIDGHRGVLE